VSPRETDEEAGRLDAAILRVIAAYDLDEGGFNALACELAAHQLRRNAPYRAFAARLGVTPEAPPRSWRDVPAVPAAAFRDAALATFDVRGAQCEFHTSGTTRARSGRHFIERADLYEASLLATFDRLMLPDGARLRYLNLVPDPRRRPHSSLGYMMRTVARRYGDGRDGWYAADDTLDVSGFTHGLREAIADGVPVCIAATAFALADILEACEATGRTYALTPGSRIMETGGFKGRRREIDRAELYARAAARFGIDPAAIVAEYGMTELCSQYYDAPRTRSSLERAKTGPPWLRTLVVDPAGRETPPGVVGTLRHVDLANRSSVVAVDTEDLGARTADGLVLLGRESGARPRGCSLDAEMLAGRAG
jgi:hypothetical protein